MLAPFRPPLWPPSWLRGRDGPAGLGGRRPEPILGAQVEKLAAAAALRPALLVNPMWNLSGQFISDFGVGPWRKAKEDLVASFVESFSLREMRIRGQVLRVLRVFPGPWCVYALGGGVGAGAAGGGVVPVLLGTLPERPSYKQVEALLAGSKESIANQPWTERVASEFKFNASSASKGGGNNDKRQGGP